MRITKKLRQWLVDHAGMAEGASDTLADSVFGEALLSGKLTVEKIAELEDEPLGEFSTEKKKKMLNRLAKDLHDAGEIDDSAAIAAMVTGKRSAEQRAADLLRPDTDEEIAAMQKSIEEYFLANAAKYGFVTDDDPTNNTADTGTSVIPGEERKEMASEYENHDGGMRKAGTFSPADVYLTAEKANGRYDAGDGDRIRVRGGDERFSTKRWTARNKHGDPVEHPFRQGSLIERPSEYELAKCGAMIKNLLRRAGKIDHSLTEMERQLLHEAATKDTWCGKLNGEWRDSIPPGQKASLLDDSTSGGQEAVPFWFDDMLISTPILFGEVAPYVTWRNMPTGSSIEGAKIGNVTVSSHTAEGSAISLFDATALVTDYSPSLFNVVAAVEVGLDMMSDSPAAIGDEVMSGMSRNYMQWLDNQFLSGDGSIEPEGIFNASSTTTVSANGGTTGPPEVQDFENLMFGIAKEFRDPSTRRSQRFAMNETSYKRARQVKVGSTDQRRVFGMNEEDYSLLGHPVSIEHNVGNQSQAFCNFSYYRAYRRAGFSVRVETGGKELAQKNLALFVARGRIGGALTLGSACAVLSNAQS